MSKHRHPHNPNNPDRVTEEAIDTRQAQVARVNVSAFQGPLPPPEILEQYNRIVPNGAERIIAMAESQINHRQSMESAVINGNVIAQRRGQLYGFLLGLIGISGGIGLIAFNKDAMGLATVITSVAGLAGVFVYGRWQQERERERKRKELKEASQQPRLPGL